MDSSMYFLIDSSDTDEHLSSIKLLIFRSNSEQMRIKIDPVRRLSTSTSIGSADLQCSSHRASARSILSIRIVEAAAGHAPKRRCEACRNRA